ncbi:MAG TPA: amino acid ABC transporter permease, partial [Aquabacterium sp.]|nr:amino acid ABC transporter permease [Aquabacterium sp.]
MLDFLFQPSGFDIGETGLLSFDAAQPLWRAILVGLGNTLRVSLPALLLATLIATLVALCRRSASKPIRTAGLV